MKYYNWIKIIFTILVIVYFSHSVATPGTHPFASGASMLVHEFGHVITKPFPLPIEVVGGTISEFAFTIGIMIYFAVKKQYYSMFIVMFFLGLSLSYTSWYIGDIVKQEGQPLIPWGGDNDWKYFLNMIGQIQNFEIISFIFRITSIWVTIIAAAGSLLFSFKKEELAY